MKASENLSSETVVPTRSKNFFEVSEDNPCHGCAAPCCRMLLIPHPTPTSYMDLDYIRYMVAFEKVQMLLNRDGHWQIQIEQVCQLLDRETNLCTVHNTPKKPKTCVFFNPYRCWYKRNFTVDNPPDIIRIDIQAIETILAHVRFDEQGNILEIPQWEFSKDLVDNPLARKKIKPS